MYTVEIKSSNIQIQINAFKFTRSVRVIVMSVINYCGIIIRFCGFKIVVVYRITICKIKHIF